MHAEERSIRDENEAEIAEHARQRANRFTAAEVDQIEGELLHDFEERLMIARANAALEAMHRHALTKARDILESIQPPAGRADLTIPQKVALAEAWASIALVEAQEVANGLSALGLGIPSLEDEEKSSSVPRTEARRNMRNRIRAYVRKGLAI